MKTGITITLLFFLALNLNAQDSLRIRNYYGEGEISVGYLHPSFSSVNSFLKSNGFNPISNNRFNWGGSALHIKNKFVFGVSFDVLIPTSEIQPGNRKTTLQGYSLGTILGYVLVQKKDFTLYPYIRGYSNFFSLKIIDNQPAVDASSLLNGVTRNSTMDYHVGTLDLGLSINKNISQKSKLWDCPQSNRYIILGLKIGYLFALDHDPAEYNNQVLSGAPALDYNGPYFKFSFGFGTRLRQLKWQ